MFSMLEISRPVPIQSGKKKNYKKKKLKKKSRLVGNLKKKCYQLSIHEMEQCLL